MLSKELVNEICKFGLTRKQARIYLCVLLHNGIKVSEIADLTKVHKQDIYKIIPKLEKLGLITKTKTNPILLESLPAKIAFDSLIQRQKNELDKQKNSAQKIIESIINRRKTATSEEFIDHVLIFDARNESLNNKLKSSYNNIRKSLELFSTYKIKKFLDVIIPIFEEHKKILKKRRVKIRILIQCDDEIEDYYKKLDQFTTLDVTIKKLVKNDYSQFPLGFFYGIVDGEELYSSFREFEKNSIKVMVTNCLPVVMMAQDSFVNSWKYSKTKTVFSTNPKKYPIKTQCNTQSK